jgi:pyruvate dehydrogenase E1 component alpha subunit
MELSREKLLWMYERMRLIRDFEDRIAGLFAAGELPGFLHFYAGEEAVAVGVCAHLNPDDFITSTHRGHGHCIAKGVDVNQMMAELYGRATGACKGKGGSMHIADVDKGMLGANGIVGGGVPLAAGAGLTAKYNKRGQVAVCFFGDGANNQGAFHEAANLAAIWKLPVIFVCENNGYAEATPVNYATSVQDIAARASAYNIPGLVVDGQDVFAVYEAAGEAVRRARAGEGPTLLECKTYRYYGHFSGDPGGYRSEEEINEAKRRDCLERFKRQVLDRGLLTQVELDEIDRRSKEAIEQAVAFAKSSPLPSPEEVTTDVYVRYP